MKIHVNSFVKRQTAESEFSYFDGSWDELAQLVEEFFENKTQGYRDGVVLVNVPPERFYSSVVLLQEGDKLIGEYKARKEGEEPRKSTRVVGGKKSPAARVDVILYHADVLKEDGDNETEDQWEIISLNANPVDEEMPIPVGALIANHFGLSGGTDTKMSDAEFVAQLRESVLFWKDKAMAGGDGLVDLILS